MTEVNEMNVFVVIPNWNGADMIAACLESLRKQTYKHTIVVVDNGSIDESVYIIEEQFPEVVLVALHKNTGFAGGVNAGIRYALDQNADAIALFNNDALADPDWLQHLVATMKQNKQAGIVTGKFLSIDGEHVDSTGDIYTTWGLLYPRGRDEAVSDAYDEDREIFGASGGASLYRATMLREIGLFDEDFFAYYEDGDISFRAQLAGWKIIYEPKATARHDQGSTSSKIKDFTTYHTIKNLPWLMWKNVPLRLLPTVWPRLTIAHLAFCFNALTRRQFKALFKGLFVMYIKLPKKLLERSDIQSSKKVSNDYIASMMTWDLPPNARRLRTLRRFYRRLTLRSSP